MSERRSAAARAFRAVCGALIVFHVPSTVAAADLSLRHDPPACILAETFPRLTARVEPAGQAARVRVVFRPEAAALWHAVTAEAAADGGFSAVIPRPRLAAAAIHYRFEAIGPSAATVTGAEYTVPVVADAAACGGPVAESVPSARVLVDVPRGAPMVPPVPPGFDPVGAVASAPHRGSSKKKLGVLAGILVGGGAVAGGVAAASSEPPPTTLLLQPTWRITSSSPPLFGQVSVSRNSMTAEIAMVSPRTLQPGQFWMVFYNQTNPINRPCAVLTGSHPLLEAGREARFAVGTPFVTASPCGLANLARGVFRSPSGQTIYESGNADLPDASVSYTFVP